MKVLVCGGRDFNDRELFDRLMNGFEDHLGKLKDLTFVHGGATGADTMAGEWAKERGFHCVVYKANWAKYGKSAGPRRNREMYDIEKPMCVIAFPGGRGTNDMVTYAESKNVMFLFDFREETTRIVTPFGTWQQRP